MQERIGVGCIVLREHPQEPVLLLRRAFGPFAEKWCFVAGHVEQGELPVEAACRELHEETGLVVPRVHRLLVHSESDLELNVFVARVSQVTPNIRLDSEHSEFGWFSYPEALRLLPLDAQRSALNEARTAQQAVAADVATLERGRSW